ncbi:MAG TPA: acyclic terpene utilization AtuA family protein [Polyangia bacterium]
MQPLRIANCSGFWGDRASGAAEMVRGGPIDVLTGDYLAELTMAILAKQRAAGRGGFVGTFLTQLEEVLAECLTRGIKIVSNAGGLDPRGLGAAIGALAQKLGVRARVAVVDGDDLVPRLGELRAAGERFLHLDRGVGYDFGTGDPLTANAYLGGWGIAEALGRGADVVVTGRVSDAALVVGPAAWKFGWARDDWDRLAGAVAAGHIIECSAQATGGNYSFFEEVDWSKPLGFPIAEMHADGSFVITKHPGTGGRVNVGTVTAQLLYEIDGARYFNPDVVARFDTITLVDEEGDRVRGSGTRGEPPPPTLKVAMNLAGGWRNAMTVRLCGLDLDDKANLVEQLVADVSGGRERFTEWHVALRRGAAEKDPRDNEAATAYLTVTVKSPDKALVGKAWSSRIVGLSLSSVPGHSIAHPPADATPFLVYWPALVDAARVPATLHFEGEAIAIAPSPTMPSADRAPIADAAPPPPSSGPTARVPLGRVFGTRSGDKGGNANLGIWARAGRGADAAYAWLAHELTVDQLRALFPDLAPYAVDRAMLPNLHAVNFTIRGILGDGVAASTRSDPQAKTLGEYVRARIVELPVETAKESTTEPRR